MRIHEWRGVSPAAIGLLLVLAADPASATIARRLSNRSLAEDAQVIVVGRCTQVRTAWEAGTLVTLASVDVSETLKGGPLTSVTVALPGGIDANREIPVAMTFAGAPQIRSGEEVFLFLGTEEGIESGYIVVGFAQGKFSIVDDPRRGKLVSRDLTELHLQAGSGVARGTQTLTSLADFKAEVTAYLQQ